VRWSSEQQESVCERASIIDDIGSTPEPHLDVWSAKPRQNCFPIANNTYTTRRRVDSGFYQAPFLTNIDLRGERDLAYASEAGMVSSISVPQSGLLEIASFPPAAMARSCMPGKP